MAVFEFNTNNNTTSHKKIRYQGSSNKPSPKGHEYEIYILSLTYLDATEKIVNGTNEFNPYIATEVNDALPFNDIVYVQVEQGEAISFYVSAKHHDKKQKGSKYIALEDFMTENPKGNFCLLTFFKRRRELILKLNQEDSFYSEIRMRNNIITNKHKFVVFTNRPLNSKIKGLRDAEEGIFLYKRDKREGKICKVEISDDPTSFYQITKRFLMAKIENVTEEDVIDFFNDLIFATEQPNVNELKQRVMEKLKHITGVSDTEWMASILASQLRDWAHRKDGWFLDRNTNLFKYINQHLEDWRQTAQFLNMLDCIKKHGIDFKDDCLVVKGVTHFLSRANIDGPRTCVVSYEQLKLTKIKISQAIDDMNKYEIILFESKCSVHNLKTLQAFKYESKTVLMVIIDTNIQFDEFLSIIKEFLKNLQNYPNKKLLLVVPWNFKTEVLGFDHEEIKDKDNSFCDLTKESQEKILRERAILFDGHRINLGLILDTHLKKCINGELLANIILKDIKIQKKHSVDKFERDNVQTYYISRQLNRIGIQNRIRYSADFYFAYGTVSFVSKKIKNKDMVLISSNTHSSDFDEMCISFPDVNIHWLERKQNNEEIEEALYWKQSHGLVENIRKYMIRDGKSKITLQDIKHRVVTISSVPGMGKSSLLSHFERETKSSFDYEKLCLMVVNTNLENHSRLFKNLSKNKVTIEDAIEMIYAASNFDPKFSVNPSEVKKLLIVDENGSLHLSKYVVNGWDALTLKVFTYFYNEGKIITLLDGLDEIAPTYDDKVLNIVKRLKETKVRKIIVTTRPYNIATKLERELNTFSYTLVPFSVHDQQNFLLKFWTNQIFQGNNTSLPDDIAQKISKFQDSCETIFFKGNNGNVFVSIPQHIVMVATAYRKHFIEYLQTGNFPIQLNDLNIYLLYNNFFQTKFEILHEDAVSDNAKHIIACEEIRKITKETHKMLAMMELFENEKLEKIIPEEIRLKLIEKVRNADEKTGFIYIDGNGKPCFLHRTFAEFFAAEMLSDMLQQRNTKHHGQYEFARHVLYDIITNIHSPYAMVFEFLYYKIESECKQQEHRDYFYEALNEIWLQLQQRDNQQNDLGRSYFDLCFLTTDTLPHRRRIWSQLFVKYNIFGFTPIHYFSTTAKWELPYSYFFSPNNDEEVGASSSS